MTTKLEHGVVLNFGASRNGVQGVAGSIPPSRLIEEKASRRRFSVGHFLTSTPCTCIRPTRSASGQAGLEARDRPLPQSIGGCQVPEFPAPMEVTGSEDSMRSPGAETGGLVRVVGWTPKCLLISRFQVRFLVGAFAMLEAARLATRSSPRRPRFLD